MSRALPPTFRAALLALALALLATIAGGAGPATPAALADHCTKPYEHDEDTGKCEIGQRPVCNNEQDHDPVKHNCTAQLPCAANQQDTPQSPCLTPDELRCRSTPVAHAWPCPAPQTVKCANYYAYQSTVSEHCDPATVTVYETGTYVNQPTPDRNRVIDEQCGGWWGPDVESPCKRFFPGSSG